MHLRKHNLISILLMLLMFGNVVGAVWIYPDVDIVVDASEYLYGEFTLNTKSAQNFTSIEIGEDYTNLSWSGITYHNITYVNYLGACTNKTIDLYGVCDLGRYETTIAFELYAPVDWTVTIVSAIITTHLGNIETLPSFSNSQVDSTHRNFTTVYNPSNTLSVHDMGTFGINISVTAENDTLIYSGYALNIFAFDVERLDPPYNVSSGFNSTYSSINTSWESGNNSDYDVVVRNNNTFPVCPSDGYEVRNSTSTFYNTSVSPGDEFYLSVFSYNLVTHCYSNPMRLLWGAIQLQCFNESNPSQAINFDIEVTNASASEVYTASDVSNGMAISFDDIPYGDNTVIIISNSSYKLRTYYKDLEVNHFYNYSFYLPPLVTPVPPDGEDPDEGELRTCTNVALVTDPTNNVTIDLTYLLDSIIGVYRYDNIPTYTSYTDSISVTNPAVNATIFFTHTPSSITTVYIYNNTIYGGWVLVPQDMYTYNSTEVEINNSWLDANTTMARVDYLYISGYVGNWHTVPDSMYTASSTDVEIDNATLNSNTTMVQASYYYLHYPNSVIDTQLYILIVVGQQGEFTSVPIEGAKIIVKRYINTTDSYEEIASLLTDANGNTEVYLIPETHLKIFVSKDGYNETISDYIPSIDIPTKTFRLYPLLPVYPDYALFFFNATKYSNNSMKVTYIAYDENTTNAQFYTYDFYNGTYTLIATNTTTNNTFIFWVNGLNNSRSHVIVLHLNHTILGYVVETLYVSPYYEPKLDKDYIENTLAAVGGYFRLGYVVTFLIYLPSIVGLLLGGRGHPGLGIIISALYLGFVNVFLASPIVFVPFIMAIGIVLMLVKGGIIKL